jgi:cbb3-type cytochrome oxidase subunit 3
MMRDVIQSAGLVIYPEVGLILLFVTFLFAVAWSLGRKRAYYEQLAQLPFDDELPESEPVARSSDLSTEPSEV